MLSWCCIVSNMHLMPEKQIYLCSGASAMAKQNQHFFSVFLQGLLFELHLFGALLHLLLTS